MTGAGHVSVMGQGKPRSGLLARSVRCDHCLKITPSDGCSPFGLSFVGDNFFIGLDSHEIEPFFIHIGRRRGVGGLC